MLGAPENEDERKEMIERCLTDLIGYIDADFEIAIHFGVPRETAAMQCKHMHGAVLRLQKLIGYEIPSETKAS